MKFSKRVLLRLKNKNKKLKPDKYKKLKRESVRGLIKGTVERPRLSVFRSNENIYAQIIDDTTAKTLVSCSTLDRDIKLNSENGRTCNASRLMGQKLAELSKQKNINRINYPRLKSHPQNEIAKRQQLTPNGNIIYGNMISIDLGNKESRDTFLKHLELFTLAESLGGVESLACVPFNMTHAAVPIETKLEMGITESLIRLSIGIENFEDLKSDLSKALEL